MPIATLVLAAAALAPAQNGVSISGLKATESVRALARDADLDPDGEQHVRARFLDARTAEPLANVRVEWFHESEWCDVATFLGECASGADGTFEAPRFVEGRRVDKLRVTKAGYESDEFSASFDAGDDEVFLDRARPLEGRVVDLDGAPIAGVAIRTRQSCAHAPPAVEARSDADGRFRLDAPPSLLHAENLEVVAERHAAIASQNLDQWSAVLERALRGEFVLRLPRRLPFDFVVLGFDGRPAARRRLIADQEPPLAVWTDELGRARVPPLAAGRARSFRLALDEVAPPLDAAWYPEVGAIRVGPRSSAGFEGPTSHLAIALRGAESEVARAPALTIFDARGRTASKTELELPRGPTRVVIGAAFSEFEEQVFDFELGPEPRVIEATPRRAAELAIHLPEIAPERVDIEAGDDSITLNDLQSNSAALQAFVPSGRKLVIASYGTFAGARRVALAPLESGARAEVHLELADACVAPPIATSSLARCRLSFKCAPKTSVAIFDGCSSSRTVELDSSAGSLEVAAGSEFRARFDADGFVPSFLIGRAACGESGALAPLRVEQHRRAEVELHGDVAAVLATGASIERAEGSWRIRAAPGPLVLRVARSANPPLELSLRLADGERRSFDIP